MNIGFGFLLAGTGKSSWGHLHFCFTVTQRIPPSFFHETFMYLLQKRNILKVIETLSLCFCWCCSRPCHTWAHHLCPRCATMNQHRLRPQWAWPFSLFGYFWQKCLGKCHVHVPTAWWLLAKQWSRESTAGMHSTHHHSDSPNPAVTAG